MGLLEDLLGVKESTGNGFADIEPGAYKLVITSVKADHDDKFVQIYWDVADGPSKGAYASSQYPPSERIYWRESSYSYLKMKMHRLYECNPQRLHEIKDKDGNFGAISEFIAAVDDKGDFSFLVGCRFAAVVRRRLYIAGPSSKNPGADRTQMEIAKWLTPDEYRSNSWPESLLADRDDRTRDVAQASVEHSMPPMPPTPTSTVDLYDEDVPF